MKLKELPYSIIQSLKLLAIDKNALGVDANESDTNVIISLTSIPYRLTSLHLVIRSLLNQNTTFKKIILWLHNDLEERVPKGLSLLQSSRFEIRYSNNTSSHRKLVETLQINKNDYIVTCDDDMMYPQDWLLRLLEDHYRYPEAIIAHACRVFRFDARGKLMPYHTWKSEYQGQGSKLTLPVGYAGILYPPNSLHSDVINKSLYTKLAPKADDFWFKAMSLQKGTVILKTSCPLPEPTPIIFTQKHSLKKGNIHRDENREQWLRISEYYKIQLLKK